MMLAVLRPDLLAEIQSHPGSKFDAMQNLDKLMQNDKKSS